MHELTQTLRNYFTLRGALLSYQRLPWDLAETEAGQLEDAVNKELLLASRALQMPAEDLSTPDTALIGESVESFIAQLQPYGSPSAILQRAGLEGDTLAQAIATELIVADLLEKVMAGAAPTEEELQALFEKNRERFVAPEQREVFHILITINDDYQDNSRERAQERLAEVGRSLAGDDTDFGEMAQRHSECPSALEQGRLGTVTRGQLYPELDEQLFGMNEGEISNVVESPLGFHLLRCGSIEPSRPLQWDEVKESLSKRITERQRRKRLQEWLKGA